MRRLAALVVLLLLLPFARPERAGARDEVRALWVVRTSLVSPESVDAMVSAARAAGFNTLLVQVRGRGDAYYRSRVEPRARALAGQPEAFDPLRRVIERAREAGLGVHAWVNANLVADITTTPLPAQHVVRRHPEWLMVPRDLARELRQVPPRAPAYLSRLAAWTRGQTATVEGLYLSPVHDGAAEHLTDVVRDLVSRYDIDGVHFDYLRYPGEAFDFSAGALDAFRREVNRRLAKSDRRALEDAAKTDPRVYPDRYPDDWLAFRQARVTALLRRLRTTVAAERPGILVSAAVVPDELTASGSRGQTWPSWLREGLLDVICPMAYTTEEQAFVAQVTRARALADRAQVWAGIGAYRLSQEQTLEHIGRARTAGVDGFVLFSYDSLILPPRGPEYLARLADAAFSR